MCRYPATPWLRRQCALHGFPAPTGWFPRRQNEPQNETRNCRQQGRALAQNARRFAPAGAATLSSTSNWRAIWLRALRFDAQALHHGKPGQLHDQQGSNRDTPAVRRIWLRPRSSTPSLGAPTPPAWRSAHCAGVTPLHRLLAAWQQRGAPCRGASRAGASVAVGDAADLHLRGARGSLRVVRRVRPPQSSLPPCGRGCWLQPRRPRPPVQTPRDWRVMPV